MLLAHDVYITLHDGSEAARARLVATWLEYLAGCDCVSMSAGGRAPEFDRPVNDQGFDVGLHVTFKDRASHDAYQAHPRHKQFVDETRPNWKTVRVFDSWVDAPPAS